MTDHHSTTATTDGSDPAVMGCINCANLMGSIRHLGHVLERQKDEHDRRLIERDQEILDLRRANRANKSRWKNARRDFLDVRAERDALREALFDVTWAVISESENHRFGMPGYDMTLDHLHDIAVSVRDQYLTACAERPAEPDENGSSRGVQS